MASSSTSASIMRPPPPQASFGAASPSPYVALPMGGGFSNLAGNMMMQRGIATAKPYRIAIRVISSPQQHPEATGGYGEENSAEMPANASTPTAAAGVKNFNMSERLLSRLPPNFCNVWLPSASTTDFQLGEIAGAAMSQGCGLYVVDCGYDEGGSVGLNDDLLAYYTRHSSALIPKKEMRSLLGIGGASSASSPASHSSSFFLSSSSSLTLSSKKEGIAVAFVSKLLAESRGQPIQFSFFSMAAVDRPVTDLLIPFTPLNYATNVASSADERRAGTLSSLPIGSVEAFTTLITNVTSSSRFTMARPYLSFGLIFRSQGVPHAMLLLHSQHQRLAIACLEGQGDALPAHLQQSLRELDAANDRIGEAGVKLGHLSSASSSFLGVRGGRGFGGVANINNGTSRGNDHFAASYGTNSNIMHDPFTENFGDNKNNNYRNDSVGNNNSNNHLIGDGGGSLLHQQQFSRVNGVLLGDIQQRRLLACNVLCHIRRTMALYYRREQRVEFFKPMYVVRIGAEQKGRDPLGIIPFVLARGSPNVLVGPQGADYRVLTRPAAGEPDSLWSGGLAAGGGGGVGGGIDQHQYAMLMAGLTPEQQRAQIGQMTLEQEREYHRVLVEQQRKLQAAAEASGLGGSVLMFKPSMAPPTDSNVFGNLGTANRSTVMNTNTTSSTSVGGVNSFSDYNRSFMQSEVTNPTMMLVPNNAATAVQSGGGVAGGASSFRLPQHNSSSAFAVGPNSSAPYFVGGMGMGGYHQTAATAAGANSPISRLSHLSRMAQSPTQVPYALLQNPEYNSSRARQREEKETEATTTNKKTKSDADRVIAEFETVRQEPGESTESALFRSELGLRGEDDSDDANDQQQQQTNLVDEEYMLGTSRKDFEKKASKKKASLRPNDEGPITTSVMAPPAVKPFMVTDNTIDDTFEYLEKEKHVCKNMTHELQKDIHAVLQSTEELAAHFDNTREAMRRKRGELDRMEAALASAKTRSAQSTAVIEGIEKEIETLKKALGKGDEAQRIFAEEDAVKEKEHALKLAEHAEKMGALLEDHRRRVFDKSVAARAEEEALRSAINSKKRQSEKEMRLAQRDVIVMSGEMTMVDESILESTNEVRRLSEEIAEMVAKQRRMEEAMVQMRQLADEAGRVSSLLNEKKLESSSLADELGILERGVAAYEFLTAEEAMREAAEAAAATGGSDGNGAEKKKGAPEKAKSEEDQEEELKSAAGMTRSRSSSLKAPVGAGGNYRLGSSTSTTMKSASGAGGTNSTGFTEEDAALLLGGSSGSGGRLSAFFALRRSVSVLKASVAKQKRTLMLRRSKVSRYRTLVHVEEAETAARHAIFADFCKALSTTIAPHIPSSYAKAFRRHEMMLADRTVTTDAADEEEEEEGIELGGDTTDNNNSAAAAATAVSAQESGGAKDDALSRLLLPSSSSARALKPSYDYSFHQAPLKSSIRGGGGGSFALSPSSPLKRSLALRSSSNGKGKNVRFVDLDTDLTTATLRLQTLKTEVQAKIRKRLSLVTSLEEETRRIHSHDNVTDEVGIRSEEVGTRNRTGARVEGGKEGGSGEEHHNAMATIPKVKEELRLEMEAVERLRAAQKEAFMFQEEELQRRRGVYMSLFIKFLPKMQREVRCHEWHRDQQAKREQARRQEEGGESEEGRGGTRRERQQQHEQPSHQHNKQTPNSATSSQQQRGIRKSEDDIVSNGVQTNATLGKNTANGHVPRYALDTASFTARRRGQQQQGVGGAVEDLDKAPHKTASSVRRSSLSSNNNNNAWLGRGRGEQEDEEEDMFHSIIKKQVETDATSTIATDQLLRERDGHTNGFDEDGGERLMHRERGSGRSTFGMGSTMDEARQEQYGNSNPSTSLRKTLEAASVSRFASAAVRHLQQQSLHAANNRNSSIGLVAGGGPNSRTSLFSHQSFTTAGAERMGVGQQAYLSNPLGLSGQIHTVVEHGYNACGLYLAWREELEKKKHLARIVEDKVEDTQRLEETVAALEEKVGRLRDRLGALATQRDELDNEKRSCAKKKLHRDIIDNSWSIHKEEDEEHLKGRAKREKQRSTDDTADAAVEALSIKLGEIQSFSEAIESALEHDEKELAALRKEVRAAAREVDSLPALLSERDVLKTETRLMESELQALQQQEQDDVANKIPSSPSPIPSSPLAHRKAVAIAFRERDDIKSAVEIAAEENKTTANTDRHRTPAIAATVPASATTSAAASFSRSALPKGIMDRIAKHRERRGSLLERGELIRRPASSALGSSSQGAYFEGLVDADTDRREKGGEESNNTSLSSSAVMSVSDVSPITRNLNTRGLGVSDGGRTTQLERLLNQLDRAEEKSNRGLLKTEYLLAKGDIANATPDRQRHNDPHATHHSPFSRQRAETRTPSSPSPRRAQQSKYAELRSVLTDHIANLSAGVDY